VNCSSSACSAIQVPTTEKEMHHAYMCMPWPEMKSFNRYNCNTMQYKYTHMAARSSQSGCPAPY
jgi:hypothetical protein